MIPRTMIKRVTVSASLAALLTFGACPDDGPVASTDASSVETDGGGREVSPTGRSYLLGGRAEAYDSQAARPWIASFDTLGDDLAEVIVVPLDLYGIPWASFTGPDNRPTTLPGPWISAVSALRAEAQASGKPIVLALSPLAPTWDTLAPEAREQSGVLVLNSSWRPYCYDPADDGDPTRWRDVYAGFVVWAVEQFEPDWVILGQRFNRYEERCGLAAYEHVAEFVDEAHRRLGELDPPRPTTIVSVDVEDLYGYPKKPGRCVATTPAACLAQRQGLLSVLEADLIGLESYPIEALTELGGLPADWLTRVAEVRADLGSAIVGTGLPALPISSGQGFCLPLFDSSEAQQAQWLDQAIAAAEAERMPLMIWRSLRDLAAAEVVASCPCAGDASLCQRLDQLGAAADGIKPQLAAGLLTLDGAERQAVSLWRQAMARE